MDILTIVKTLLKITDNEQDTLLEIYIDMATQSILNYCNIIKLPEQLKFVLANFVINLYNEQGLLSSISVSSSEIKEESVPTSAMISSISEAGRTVSFDTSQTKTKQALNNLETLKNIIDEKITLLTELNRFRSFYKFL